MLKDLSVEMVRVKRLVLLAVLDYDPAPPRWMWEAAGLDAPPPRENDAPGTPSDARDARSVAGRSARRPPGPAF